MDGSSSSSDLERAERVRWWIVDGWGFRKEGMLQEGREDCENSPTTAYARRQSKNVQFRDLWISSARAWELLALLIGTGPQLELESEVGIRAICW